MSAVLSAAPQTLVSFAYILLSVHKISDDIYICELVRERMQRLLLVRHHAYRSDVRYSTTDGTQMPSVRTA